MEDRVDLKINKSFGRWEAGEIIQLAAIDGFPSDVFWQKRLRDSATDGCCELVKAKAASKGPSRHTPEEKK